MTHPLPPAFSRLARRALDWVAVELLDARCAPNLISPQAYADLLIAHGVPDHRLAQRAAEPPRDRPSPASTLDDAASIANDLFTLHGGLCALKPGRVTRALVRIIDADAFTCLHPRLRLPADESFDWCPTPPPADVGPLHALANATIDTHVHLGGILPPSYFWIALCGGQLPLNSLDGLPGAARRFAPGSAWIDAVAGAAADRLALAAKLQQRASHRTFRDAPCATDPRWQPFLRRLDFTDEPPPLRMDVLEMSWELRQEARPGDPFVDPLRARGARHYLEGERRLLVTLADHLRREQPRSQGSLSQELRSIEVTLWRYLRVRNAFHQALVLDRGSGGLTRFLDLSRRRRALLGTRRQQRQIRHLIVNYQRGCMRAAIESQITGAFPTDATGGPQRELEIRTHIPAGRHAIWVTRAWLEGIADALDRRGAQRHRIGILFHVGKRAPDKHPRDAVRHELRVVEALLEAYPGLRRVVLGLDAAGDERCLPPRTIAATMVELRRGVAHRRARPSHPPWQLGWTFHVGEDGWDMLTALRHIDEVAHLILPSTGGRLGHATALADRPERFYDVRDGYTEPERRAHLLDLVWAWGRLHDEADPKHGQLVRSLEQRLGHFITRERAARGWRRMGLARGDRGRDDPILDEDELMRVLVPGAARRTQLAGELTLEGRDREWLALLDTMQHLMRRRLSESPITIEVNPTSNLVIGQFGDYDRLPYDVLVDAGIPVSLNTDDPGLFLTTLSHEFALMHAARMRTPGATTAGVTRWLRDRLQQAVASRFIREDTPDGTEWAADRAGLIDALTCFDPE